MPLPFTETAVYAVASYVSQQSGPIKESMLLTLFSQAAIRKAASCGILKVSMDAIQRKRMVTLNLPPSQWESTWNAAQPNRSKAPNVVAKEQRTLRILTYLSGLPEGELVPIRTIRDNMGELVAESAVRKYVGDLITSGQVIRRKEPQSGGTYVYEINRNYQQKSA